MGFPAANDISDQPDTPASRGKTFSLPRKWRAASANSSRSQLDFGDGDQIKTQKSNSSIWFDSQSDATDETAITSIQDSSLDVQSGGTRNDAIVQELASQQRKDATRMQNSTSFAKRVMWISKDREDYKTCIRRITESNDLIEGLVRARALNVFSAIEKAKVRTNPAKVETAKSFGKVLSVLPAEDRTCIDTLTRLHGALIQSRKSTEITSIATSHFGLKASLEHSLTRETLLADFEQLPFRTTSQVYVLQASMPSRAKESTLLLAESPIELSLTQLELQVPKDNLDPFVHLGDFNTEPSDIHRLYRDSTSWESTMSLRDLISSTEKPPSKTVRFRLAALLATIHLHSAGLSYTPGQLHPDNFKYFDVSSEAEPTALKEMLEDEDRLLSLYYFSGIGSARPRSSTRSIGALKGTTPTFDVATTEMGLLLYQIGSWQPLDYGKASSTAARERLRESVKQKVHELNRETGLRYAETVEKCLGWRHAPAKTRQAELPRLYEVVKSLKDLDEGVGLGSLNVTSMTGCFPT